MTALTTTPVPPAGLIGFEVGKHHITVFDRQTRRSRVVGSEPEGVAA